MRRADGLVLLLTPPFDRTRLEPGYIKGYLPGVRENGGQYTHAATWAVIAFAALGDGDKAGELFSILNPINHTSTRGRASTATRSSPTSSRATCTRNPRTSVAAAGPGTRGRRGGCTGPGSSGSSASGCAGTRLVVDPCIPRAWPGFTIAFRHHSARYDIVVENPQRRDPRGVDAWRSMASPSATKRASRLAGRPEDTPGPDRSRLSMRPAGQPIATAALQRSLKFGNDNAFQLELRRRVDEHFRTTGRRQRDCWQMYLKTAILARRLRGLVRAPGVRGPDLVAGPAAGHPARVVRGRDRVQHPARRRPSGLLELPLGQHAHGDDAGADRGQLLPLALEARRLPSHLRQHHRPRHRHRPRHSRPADAASEAARVSPVAAPVPLAALRVAGHQVAAPRRFPEAHQRAASATSDSLARGGGSS